MVKTLLSIAGYDPSSGAGVLLDTAIFRRFGFCGMGILTAVTVQNPRRVRGYRCFPRSFLYQQYEVLAREVSFSGVKVGMLGTGIYLRVLERILAKSRNIPVVIDPVFRSSSGKWLLEKKMIPSYVALLKGNFSLLTPNLEEAALISGRRVETLEEMKEAAQRIAGRVDAPCLVKGGHLKNRAADVLYDGRRIHVMAKPKIKRDVRGTGCFLSSSLLCYLVRGFSLIEACQAASALTGHAIEKAVRLGEGGYIFSPLLALGYGQPAGFVTVPRSSPRKTPPAR